MKFSAFCDQNRHFYDIYHIYDSDIIRPLQPLQDTISGTML